MQWHAIAGTLAGAARRPGTVVWDGSEPEEGNLGREALPKLCAVLARHTPTREVCYFALWEGYGWLPGSPSASPDFPTSFPAEAMNNPRLHHPGRNYLLFSGPLEAATKIGWYFPDGWFAMQSPNLFRPADRSWCVATEIDFDSTIVAGSSRLIADILAEPTLETWPIALTDLLTYDADALNT